MPQIYKLMDGWVIRLHSPVGMRTDAHNTVPAPKTQGTLWEKGLEDCKSQRTRESVSSRHDREAAPMKS